jgi:hypothetical protein
MFIPDTDLDFTFNPDPKSKRHRISDPQHGYNLCRSNFPDLAKRKKISLIIHTCESLGTNVPSVISDTENTSSTFST